MYSSMEEALLHLNKWKTESTSMSFALVGTSVQCWLVGSIDHVSATEVHIRIRGIEPPECLVVVSLTGAEFNYSDEREGSKFHKFASTRKFSGLLVANLPNGERFIFAEPE